MSVFTTLLQGVPAPSPATPEDSEDNQKWLADLETERIKEAEAPTDLGGVEQPNDTLKGPSPAVSPTGDTKLDKTFNDLSVTGFFDMAPGQKPFTTFKLNTPTTGIGGFAPTDNPAQAPDVVPDQAARDSTLSFDTVSEDPAVRTFLRENLKDLPDAVQSSLLGIYQRESSKAGPQEALRRVLIHAADNRLPPDLRTGWPDYPKGEPTDTFWERYLGGLDEATQRNVRDMYKQFRLNGIPKVDPTLQGIVNNTNAPLISRDAPASSVGPGLPGSASNAVPTPPGVGKDKIPSLLDRYKTLGLDGRGSLSPMEAFSALREWEQTMWPNGRPEAQVQAADLLLNGLVALPVSGPLGLFAPFASHEIQHNLPESTPDSVRTAIDFGVYGVLSKGSFQGTLRQRATRVASEAAVGGGSVAVGDVAGVNPVVSAFVGPVLSPFAARLGAQHYSWIKGVMESGEPSAESLAASVRKTSADLGPNDLGSMVLMGDRRGHVSGLPDGNTIHITLDDGTMHTVPRSDVLFLPGSEGTGTTWASVAQRVREGKNPPNDTAPMTVTRDAVADMDLADPARRADFLDVMTAVARGEAPDIVLIDRPIAGGADPFPSGSPELNLIASNALNNAIDYDMWIRAMAKGSVSKTLPSTKWGAAWLFFKSGIGLNPGARKAVQPAFSAAFNLAESRQVRIALQEEMIHKGIKEFFSPDVLSAWEAGEASSLMRASYRGPQQSVNYAIGTGPHVANHPEWYNLSPEQHTVLENIQRVFDYNAKHLIENVGVNFGMVDGVYVPLRRAEETQTFAEKLLAPQRKGAAVANRGRPSFTRPRENATFQEWVDYLDKHGELAETNLFKLVNQRLQGAARLEADQMFMQGVAKAYGKPIVLPQAEKALREQVAKVQQQIRTKLATALRQDVRGTTLENVVGRFETLIRGTEEELLRIEGRLQSGSVQMGSHLWDKLEGYMNALDKAANHYAGGAQNINQAAQNQTFKLANTRAEIVNLRNTLATLQDRVSHNRNATAPHGWREIGLGRLPTRTMVPDEIAAEVDHVTAPNYRGDISGRVEDFLSWLRSTMLSSDASWATKQGYDLWTVNPVAGMSRYANGLNLARSQEGFMTWVAQNWDTIHSMTNAGMTFSMSATDAARAVGKGQQHIWDKSPAFHLDQMGFGRFVPILKTTQGTSFVQYLSNLQNDQAGLQALATHLPAPVGARLKKWADRWAGLEKNGVPIGVQEIHAASADMINNIGGGLNWGKFMGRPDLWQSTSMLTPGWLRANVGRIVDAARVGDPRGVIARRFFFQNMAISAGLSTALSLALSGRTPNYDPTAGDFLDVQVGPNDQAGEGGSFSILPDKAYVRTIFQTLAGQTNALDSDRRRDIDAPFISTGFDPLDQRIGAVFNFESTRTGMVPRLGIDLVKGEDIFGRKIDNPLLYAMRSFIPLIGQQALDTATKGAPSGALGLATFGFNWNPKSPYQTRDQAVAHYGDYYDEADPTRPRITKYSDLTDSQRADFNTKHPEFNEQVRQWQDERDSPFNALRDVRDQHRIAIEVLGKAFVGQPLTDQERSLLGPNGGNVERVKNNPVVYRQWLASLADHYQSEADKKTGSLPRASYTPETVSGKIVADYYSQVVEKSKIAGGIDYTLYEANERAYRRQVSEKYGPSGLNVLDQELLYRTADDPIAAGYHKDQTTWAPYFDYLDSFWTSANLKSAGFNDKDAREAAQFPNQQQYKAWLSIEFQRQLEGKALPTNLYNYRTSPDADKTLGERWGVIKGKPLSQAQAQDIGEELARVKLADYSKRVGIASDKYLVKNTETLCAAAYWGIIEPTEAVRPYLKMCPVRPK